MIFAAARSAESPWRPSRRSRRPPEDQGPGGGRRAPTVRPEGRQARECLAVAARIGRSNYGASLPSHRAAESPSLPPSHPVDAADPFAGAVPAGPYAGGAEQGAVPLRAWQRDALAQFEASASP